MQAQELGIVGFCKNTPEGTVVGTIQGPEGEIAVMKKWLTTTGSPRSKIERVEFSDERKIDAVEYESFGIDKSYGFAPR
jgi:acylphosphatase